MPEREGTRSVSATMPGLDSPRSVASFRDPGGFVFERDGVLYRQVNRSYRADYDRLLESGLHRRLVDDGWLVAHDDVDVDEPARDHRSTSSIRGRTDQ